MRNVHYLFFLCAIIFSYSTMAQNNNPGDYWENETIFKENKEDGHATYIPYSSTTLMLEDDFYNKPWLEPKSERFMSLNGT